MDEQMEREKKMACIVYTLIATNSLTNLHVPSLKSIYIITGSKFLVDR